MAVSEHCDLLQDGRVTGGHLAIEGGNDGRVADAYDGARVGKDADLDVNSSLGLL